MNTSNLGDITLRALRCLKDSGPTSFEQLTANLLSDLISFPVRLCKSGEQGGIDALAEIPLAIEDKRFEESRLAEGELAEKLNAAAQSYPDLQLWILTTTTELSAQINQALRQKAETLGLGILVLDSASAQPQLLGIPTIAALAATNIAVTLQAVSDQNWWDRKKAVSMPQASEVECDLRSIEALSRFSEWVERLRTQLHELPLWQFVIERQNSRLLQLLTKGAHESFGTAFDPSSVVPRTAKSEINKWLDLAIKSHDPEIAVIQGDRYDGKTWCVFDWLKENLKTLPLPVFFIGSNRGIDSSKSLEIHILDEIKRSLGQFERHAETVVRRQRNAKAGETPWCLVILDGLNEYLPNFDKCLGHIFYASGRTDLDSRPCALLTTVRRQSWTELSFQVQGQKRVIEVGPYDDVEFRAALKLRGLSENYLDSLPTTVHELIRRPRYLGLVIDHQAKLGDYESVTPDALNWLDACDKIARSKSVLGSDWGVEQYQEVLRNLAAHIVEQGSFNLTDMHSRLGLPSNILEAIEDLKSEGVLVKIGTRFRLRSDRLALGMGLWILDKVSAVMARRGDVVECIRNILAPDPETEEKLAWLRAATIVALLYEPALPSDIIDSLVNEWLRARNLSPQDFQEIKAVRRLLLPSLLRLAPKTWSVEGGEPRLQELSRMVFADALVKRRGLISEAVQRWFRLVPRAGSRVFQKLKENEDTAGLIQSEVNALDLADLGLQICDDEGVLGLHRVGLFLLNKIPDLVEPLDLLALLVAKAVAFDSLGDGERFIIRRALDRVDAAWFAKQVRQAFEKPPGRWRNHLHYLMIYAERAALVSLAEKIKPPVDPQWEYWERGRIKNRSRYEEVSSLPFAEEDNSAHFIREVSELVCDPDLPQPCEERLATIRKVLTATFSNVELGTSRGQTREDADFEWMLSAMAAWMPDIGVDVMHQQILKLADNGNKKALWWMLELKKHSILAEGSMRTVLMQTIREALPENTERQMAVGVVLQVLFPGIYRPDPELWDNWRARKELN